MFCLVLSFVKQNKQYGDILKVKPETTELLKSFEVLQQLCSSTHKSKLRPQKFI